MKKHIEVISTNRKNNTAYVAVQVDEPFYSAWNAEVYLNWIESVMGCKFDDGFHPFVRCNIDELIQFSPVDIY
jgi:hypothetical protein